MFCLLVIDWPKGEQHLSGMIYLLMPCFEKLCGSTNSSDGQAEIFALIYFSQTSKGIVKISILPPSSVLYVCVQSYRVSNKIKVTIFTMSGGGRAMGLCEALENRVRPLVKGRELKRLEGADGQTGEKKKKQRKK